MVELQNIAAQRSGVWTRSSEPDKLREGLWCWLTAPTGTWQRGRYLHGTTARPGTNWGELAATWQDGGKLYSTPTAAATWT